MIESNLKYGLCYNAMANCKRKNAGVANAGERGGNMQFQGNGFFKLCNTTIHCFLQRNGCILQPSFFTNNSIIILPLYRQCLA